VEYLVALQFQRDRTTRHCGFLIQTLHVVGECGWCCVAGHVSRWLGHVWAVGDLLVPEGSFSIFGNPPFSHVYGIVGTRPGPRGRWTVGGIAKTRPPRNPPRSASERPGSGSGPGHREMRPGQGREGRPAVPAFLPKQKPKQRRPRFHSVGTCKYDGRKEGRRKRSR
jgi:hypothetical protein